jgi:hypothetical protein
MLYLEKSGNPDLQPYFEANERRGKFLAEKLMDHVHRQVEGAIL